MKLSTIWTLRGLSLRERVDRTTEHFWMSLAHRLPRKLAYWSYIDSGVRYMESFEVVPEVPYTALLNRMGNN